MSRLDEDLRALAAELRASVRPEATARVVARAWARRRRRRTRLVVTVAVLGLMVIGNVAFAATIDRAVPGDLLYPLDRAQEWLADRLGGLDRTPERVSETAELVARGDYEAALELARAVGVKELVAATANVSSAAQSGDQAELEDAIADVKAAAEAVAEEASGGMAGGDASDPASNPGNKPEDSPSLTRGGPEDAGAANPVPPEDPGSDNFGSGGNPGAGSGGGQGQGNQP